MIKSVPLSKIEDFRKALAALNKKQARYGLPQTSARETGRHAEYVQFVVHQKGDRPEQDSVRTAKVLFVNYEVNNLGMVRNDEGYRYVGTRSKDKNGVSVFCCEEKYREKVAEATDLCDHCGTVRNRKQYHVFAKDDGTIVRVGSVCCKEYFGLDASAALDMYVKTVTVWGDKSPASFDPETDEVFSWNDIYPHVKNFTKGFSEWGDHVIEYGVAPSKEDFSAEIEEIKKLWRGEAMGNAFMAARFGRPGDSFASNCADLMDYDFVSRNRLK
ncbi:MAG: hypothetical protein J6Y62_03220, partial [Clostridia bacterium]|nr:hypothetical protein [Clostridia bacterium]